ncbi:MAG: MlaD family protein [Candidatus Cloacimonadaceae bacterium]|nr:MlaD family protein [Candidatus Cloacimonadaceae bacterium]
MKFYTNTYKTQVKVGLFTLIIGLFLLISYLWLTNSLNVGAQQELKLSFDNVMGLEIGDKVMFRGMEAGRIREIRIKGDRVFVSAKIGKDFKLKDGSRFYISDSSLMGGKGLFIEQGSRETWLAMDKTHTGESPAGVMSIVAKASSAIDEMKSMMAQLGSKEGIIGKSSNMIDDAGAAARSVDALATDMNTEIGAVLSRIDALTAQINSIVNANRENVNNVLASSPMTMQNLNHTLDSLQVLSGKLHQTVDGVNRGKGSAGLVMTEDELYRRLMESVNNLDALVKDVKSNPKKYVKFSIF